MYVNVSYCCLIGPSEMIIIVKENHKFITIKPCVVYNKFRWYILYNAVCVCVCVEEGPRLSVFGPINTYSSNLIILFTIFNSVP